MIPITEYFGKQEKKKWKYFLWKNKPKFYPNFVSSHKERFGQQDYCETENEIRYWVWEFNEYEVRVSNQDGIMVDVTSSLSKEKALEKWKEYMDKWNE